MGLFDWLKPKANYSNYKRFQELGSYQATFSRFGKNLFASEIVRSCIRPLAEHSSKANVKCVNDPRLERILNYSPNIYMSGKDFLSKVRIKLELYNNCFIYIARDDKGKAIGFYPVPYQEFEALEYNNELYVKFYFASGATSVFSWKDLAVLRKDYNESDISGDNNNAIIKMLELINTTNEGVANAVKSTANLRGILKSTKAMLSPEDIKKQKDLFVKDYLSLENEGGIASLDATQDFTPITMNPTIANFEQMKEFREDVYRYFGVSDAIVMSNYTESQMEAFYESRIEPFLVALSLELTRKVYTERELGFGNKIIYESNRMQYASNTTKLNMIQLVDRAVLTPNELRMIFNLAPYEGGDEFVRRLDTMPINESEENNNAN